MVRTRGQRDGRERANSLLTKLDGATQALEKHDTPAAKNILKAASNQVVALVRSRRISQEAATTLQELIGAAAPNP